VLEKEKNSTQKKSGRYTRTPSFGLSRPNSPYPAAQLLAGPPRSPLPVLGRSAIPAQLPRTVSPSPSRCFPAVALGRRTPATRVRALHQPPPRTMQPVHARHAPTLPTLPKTGIDTPSRPSRPAPPEPPTTHAAPVLAQLWPAACTQACTRHAVSLDRRRAAAQPRLVLVAGFLLAPWRGCHALGVPTAVAGAPRARAPRPPRLARHGSSRAVRQRSSILASPSPARTLFLCPCQGEHQPWPSTPPPSLLLYSSPYPGVTSIGLPHLPASHVMSGHSPFGQPPPRHSAARP
jgi:hypothetical protein